jgi:hypothetical protein
MAASSSPNSFSSSKTLSSKDESWSWNVSSIISSAKEEEGLCANAAVIVIVCNGEKDKLLMS